MLLPSFGTEESWGKEMVEKVNVCCGFFTILNCAGTEGHKHIGCEVKIELDGNPIIDNEHAKTYCLSENFKDCLYYPKWG